MQISLAPILLAIELVFLFLLAGRSARIARGSNSNVPVYGLLVCLTVCGIIAGVLGARGVYLSEAVLNTYPGLWLPSVMMVVALVPVVLSGRLRCALRQIVDTTPIHWFAWFHALRIAALGTAYKTAIGEFPASFEYGVGVPDLLFGVSAVWMAVKLKRHEISEKRFMVWNLIGALVIVPGAPILIQLGLPGPLQVFTSLPDARAAFTYPMSIAPTAGVPLFVLINLWVAWRLWERNCCNGSQSRDFS